jgi:hypothetical protein
MTSIKTAARRAGMLYLLLAIVGPFNDIYVPNAFIVSGDATATAGRIAAAELTYRLGIYSGLVAHVLFLLLALSLYHLLKDADRKSARLMVTLVVVGVAVGIVNLFNQIAPLILSSGAGFLPVFSKPQLDALAFGFLRLRSSGTYLAMAFWGLWLFPFGILVIKSGFIPKVLGFLLIVGCFAYLTVSCTAIVFPAQIEIVSRVMLPLFAVGELSMIVWLLVKGARDPVPQARPSPAIT